MLTPTVTDPKSAPTVDHRNNDLGKKDIFLKLLVAQMRYQNPEKPQDPTQMSAQLAQFNMVEQQTKTNKTLERLLAAQSNAGKSLAASPASLLGKNASFNIDKITHTGGSHSLSVDLPADAQTLNVVITDGKGNPVRNLSLGASSAGPVPFTWDGLDDLGRPLPSGEYHAAVSAFDASGKQIAAKLQRSGVISSVRLTGSGVEVMIGGRPVKVSDITQLSL